MLLNQLLSRFFFILTIFSVGVVFPQSNLKTQNWQEDLRFLQSTIHDDYSFLFKKTTAKDFDTAVQDLYEHIPELSDHEIIVGFSKLVSSFKYGHTRVSYGYLPKSFHQFPVNFYQFKDGMFVQGVSKTYKEILGAELLEIAGHPVNDVLEAIYPVVPSENNQFFKAYAPLYINSPEVLHAQGITKEFKSTVDFTFKKDGEVFKESLKMMPDGALVPTNYGLVKQDSMWLDARNQSITPYYLKHLDKVYYFEYLPVSKTVYVRHSQIQDDSSENIPEFYHRLFKYIEKHEVDRLVIDVRLNGGGDNTKIKPIITGLIKCEKINQVGKLFVIIGRRTFSASQNLVNEISNYCNAIFVGEPTGENINFYADPHRIELPHSRLKIYLSFAWWQDKAPWENGEWTKPQLGVEMSFDDYTSGRDPVLEEALSFSDKKFILEPMKYIANLFFQGRIDLVRSELFRMTRDHKYDFCNFEEELNKAGFQLLRSKLHQEAISVFLLNTELFPNSIDTWYNLAEGYLQAGNVEMALLNYKKVAKMNSNTKLTNIAKNKIDLIENSGL